MNVDALIIERVKFALGRLDLTPTYRQLLQTVAERHLTAQFKHFEACKPPAYLPFLCCEANGVDPKRAVGVASAWYLLELAAHLLDKVEDQELELIGVPHSARGIYTNLSTGMIFVAEWILNHLELDCVDAGAAWDIQRAFQETVLAVCSGQHLDLSVASPDLSTCWQIAEAKSGSAFALACYVGTRAATNQSERLRAMENFGRCLGTIIQISDDIEDLGSDPHHDDRKPILSPLVKAYRAHISAYHGASRPPSSSDQPQTVPLNNSLILYLRLEALKYAELARNELNAFQFALSPREQILAILNHLSLLGASVN